jgi:hypothetical protein
VGYDEAQVALSQVVLSLSKIPHAMGPRSGMKYEGWLLTLAKGEVKPVREAESMQEQVRVQAKVAEQDAQRHFQITTICAG